MVRFGDADFNGTVKVNGRLLVNNRAIDNFSGESTMDSLLDLRTDVQSLEDVVAVLQSDLTRQTAETCVQLTELRQLSKHTGGSGGVKRDELERTLNDMLAKVLPAGRTLTEDRVRQLMAEGSASLTEDRVRQLVKEGTTSLTEDRVRELVKEGAEFPADQVKQIVNEMTADEPRSGKRTTNSRTTAALRAEVAAFIEDTRSDMMELRRLIGNASVSPNETPEVQRQIDTIKRMLAATSDEILSLRKEIDGFRNSHGAMKKQIAGIYNDMAHRKRLT